MRLAISTAYSWGHEVADIFISYSKKDADQARLIAALLEAQGYSVWWDTSLETGDEFRHEITQQLDAAKAVVVLWTDNSVKSVWVNAEASRAYSVRKLVPLKARLLPADQIPLPFSELQTTNVANHEAVLAAVKTQLAKPPAPPAVWKKVRHEALTWFGIVGGALTLSNNITALREASKWVGLVLIKWRELLLDFWKPIFSLFGYTIPRDIALGLSAVCFLAGLSVGAVLDERRTNQNKSRYYYIFTFPMIFGAMLFVFDFLDIILVSEIDRGWGLVCAPTVLIVAVLISDGYIRDRLTLSILYFTFFCISFNLISNIEFLYPISRELPLGVKQTSWAYSVEMIHFYLFLSFSGALIMAPIFLSPSRSLSKRLISLLIGVALIFGLSEVSKLVENFSAVASQGK
jgi:hypothetical protein